jgi:5-bromo-4-chloroindolyl phosphate hydrolysis protein
MEQLTIQSLGFLIGFQEDINIIIVVVVVIIIMIMIMIMIIIIIIILACPDARCESGQTSGSCRNIILHHCILSQEL